MENIPKVPGPIILIAKNHACNCHDCVSVECSNCKKKVFQTKEKMDIFNKNKNRAYNFCPSCVEILREKAPPGGYVEVNMDAPKGNA